MYQRSSDHCKIQQSSIFDRFWQPPKITHHCRRWGGTYLYFKYHLISSSFQIFVDLLQCTCSKPKNNFYLLGPLVRILNIIQNPDSTKKFLAFLQSTLSKLILNWIHSSHVNRIIESILLNSARKILPPHPVSTRAILDLLLLSTRIKLSKCHHPCPVAGCGHCLEVRAEDNMINYKGHRSESAGRGKLCFKKVGVLQAVGF